MYSSTQHNRVVLKPSPSLVYNNLCALGAGVAYIHTRSAAVIGTLPEASSNHSIEASKIDIQDFSLVQAICACVVDGSNLLVLGNEQGLQVWDALLNNLVFLWKLPRSQPPLPHHADFVKSLCFNMAADGSVQLCAGCSNGTIQVFSINPGMSIKAAASIHHQGRPIISLASAFQSRRGGWADDIGCELVSCDEQGNIRVWQAHSSGSYVDTGLEIKAGCPCCSMAVRKGFIVAAGTDGSVRIYNLKNGQLRHEIVAHSRWLSAMDIHPSKDNIVTAAEDCTVGVWQLPIAGAKFVDTNSTTRNTDRMAAAAPAAGLGAEPMLTYWERNPPYAAIALAQEAKVELQHAADPKATKETITKLQFPNREELTGVSLILKFITRLGIEQGSSNLYGLTPLAACQVDQWLDTSTQLVSGLGFETLCGRLNDYLSLRSFFVGFTTTAADFAIWGQLQACPLWKKVKQSGTVPHLTRWFDFMTEQPACSSAINQLCYKQKVAAAVEADRAAGKGGGGVGSFDVGLPDAVPGKVVTRFPPEPSGYLHIGHAKAALLNQHFASIYNGRLLVRFDDTNPTKEKDEYVENIIKDMETLGLQYKTITYTSDYFPQMLELGEKLIKAGVLYADDTPVEQMREERMHGVESKCRNRKPEETLAIFKEMQQGTERGLANCLRFKLDMQNPNKALRDPVAFRCNLTPHWRTGEKYKVYPTYDYACPFVDALEGVTHALRTSEYKDREAQYYWILEQQQKLWPGLPHVHIWDYSRLNFVYTVLSKRKLTWFVDTGRVDGWDDPRMPTVQGIIRRGLQVEALREYILSQGASKNVTYQEWDKIWTINKRIIDPVCPRHTAVVAAGRVPVTITGAPATLEASEGPKHKKNPAAGTKKILKLNKVWLDQADGQVLNEGEEVTLMDWDNAFIRSVTKDSSGQVTAVTAELNPGGDFKKTKLKLTWLADVAELVPLVLTEFDYLITKKKVEEEDDFHDLVNPKTKFETQAVGDVNMTSLKKGDIIQLERKGYYVVDQPHGGADKPAILFNIPDGRTKNMGLVAEQQ